MTEAEWLTCVDPAKMLGHLLNAPPQPVTPPAYWPSDRKLRLFAVACCRRVPHEGPRALRARGALDAAERFADEPTFGRREAMKSARNSLRGATGFGVAARLACLVDAAGAAREVSAFVDPSDFTGGVPFDAQAALVRDIVGNPFRPVTLCGMERKPFHSQHAHVAENGGFWLEDECPVCRDIRTPQVLSLAGAAYEDRGEDGTLDPVRLAVLADALEEAGCGTGHAERPCERCRGRGSHVIFAGPGATKPKHRGCSACGGTGSRRETVEHPLRAHLRGPTCVYCEGEGMICDAGGGGLVQAVPASRVVPVLRYSDDRVCHWCEGTGRAKVVHVRGCWALDQILGRS